MPEIVFLRGPQKNLFRIILSMLLQNTQRLLPRLLAEAREQKPDYVLFDTYCVWGRYVARILRLPAVGSNTGLALNWRVVMTDPARMVKSLWQRWTGRRYVKDCRAILTDLRRRYALPSDSLSEVLSNRGDMNLVYTSRMFQPCADSFDSAKFKFIGPCIVPRPQAPMFPFESLGGKPLIYISLGTVFNDQATFYRKCFEAFANGPCQVALSVGSQVKMESLGSVPSNFIVRNRVPQLEVLQRAALFVTHGGMNSVSEALYDNVPLVVIPQSVDQPFIAKRVARLGAGLSLSPHRVTVPRLRGVVEEILANPSFARAAAEVGESLRTAGGFVRAVDEIEGLKTSNGIT